MEEAKIVRVIKVLDLREFKRFITYVESPYFNKNQKLIKLLYFIVNHHPEFNPEEFSEENAFEFVFPDEVYKSGAITKLLSKLFKLLTEFFTIEKALDSTFDIEFTLLQRYWEKNLDNDFDRLSQKVRNKQKLNKDLKTKDYYNKYLIEREVNKVLSTRKDKGVGDVHIKNATKALDIYYLFTKLIYTCQEINRKNVVKGVEIDGFNTKMVEMIPDTPYKDEPIIDIWYTAYLLLISEDKSLYYNDLKDKLYAHHEIPERSLLRMLFTFLENATLKLFKERKELYKELFELYNFQMERGVLLNDQVFIPGVIKNYLTVSLNLNKLKEARSFLEKIKPKVIKIHPNDFRFCEAMLLFAEKKYEETLDALNEVNFSNIVMKLNERTMRLKVYYHLGYFDLLYDNLNSFRVFLTNNKNIISDRLLDANRRFSNYLSKIVKNNPVVLIDMKDLKLSIQEDTKTIEKKWLLEQVSSFYKLSS